jgi:hypothetical protein
MPWKIRSRLQALDLRLIAGSLGLIFRGVAWSCGFIVLLFAGSMMPSFFQRIPPEIQFACQLLAALAAFFFIRMLIERRRALAAYNQFGEALSRFRQYRRQSRSTGVPEERMEQIRAACDYFTGTPHDWWASVDESLEYYEAPDQEGGWFLTRPVQEILPEEDLVEPYYHASFHQAVPGILTALGLLATFSAILVALSNVSYNAANAVQPVTGIDGLINGLAGKFLSSIIALILSVTFTLVERKYCERQIQMRIDALRALIRNIFPYLTQTRILLDLQRIALETRQERLAEMAPADPPVAVEEPTRQDALPAVTATAFAMSDPIPLPASDSVPEEATAALPEPPEPDFPSAEAIPVGLAPDPAPAEPYPGPTAIDFGSNGWESLHVSAGEVIHEEIAVVLPEAPPECERAAPLLTVEPAAIAAETVEPPQVTDSEEGSVETRLGV